MKRTAIIVAATVVGAALAQVIGCTSSKVQPVNVSQGQYYTEDEYAALSGHRKDSYCEALTERMQVVQSDMEARQREIEDTRNHIATLRGQIVPLQNEVIRLDAEIRTLNDQIKAVKSLPKEWKVKPGESLTLIAMNEQVYNDIDKWWKIFEANQDKIDDPYYIFPDTVLVIPRDWPIE